MATVGQQLTAPETGWKRFDDTDQNIDYVGNNWTTLNRTPYYNSTRHTASPCLNQTIQFNFTGTRLRVIAEAASDSSKNIQISIDGVSNVYDGNPSGLGDQTQTLVYELTGLSNKKHYVKIMGTDNGWIYFDAIDIDDTGELLPILDNPSNLTANAGDSQVTLSWTAVTGATGYNVKRATTAGGPYTTIASNVFGTSYVDTTVTNGTTYYYVVTAVNADGESANSNEASATPVGSSKALLRVTMNDSSEREYQLSATEADNFIKWYDRTLGTGNTCYAFDKNVGLETSKEYLAFEKIISFEVKPSK